MRRAYVKWTLFIKPQFHQQPCLEAGCFLQGRTGDLNIREWLLERCMTVEVWRPQRVTTDTGTYQYGSLLAVLTILPLTLRYHQQHSC